MKAQIKKAGFGFSINAVVDVVCDVDNKNLFVKSKHLARSIPKSAVEIIKEITQ
ncbi:hypothetical protein [Psychromonas sp. MME2]|uniref:hypothetical protein n=1 Tax=unclassified Psychromonas TaxID=2614957 RepID=UPI00339C19A1